MLVRKEEQNLDFLSIDVEFTFDFLVSPGSYYVCVLMGVYSVVVSFL
jgi:hypothetical protein